MSRDLVLFLIGVIVTIILVVLDKAGRLKGPMLFILLGFAAVITLPLALGNTWVIDAAPPMLKFSRGLFMVCIVGLSYSLIAIWISTVSPDSSKRPEENNQPDKPTNQISAETSPIKKSTPSLLFVFGAPLGENDSPVWVMMLKHYGPNTAFNCDIQFYDDDRKNIEHQWLVEHGSPSFLPPGGVAGRSQLSFRIPEAGPERSPEKFQ
jgi:hypothetical protein